MLGVWMWWWELKQPFWTAWWKCGGKNRFNII
jgi:hypothetical protein